MDRCYRALHVVVLLFEGFKDGFIPGDLGAGLVVCGMKPRCTDSILIREEQKQPLELCIKVRRSSAMYQLRARVAPK